MMGLGDLIPFLKPVAEVGVLVLMAVVVAGAFVWLIRFYMPKLAEVERLQRDAVEARHRAERDAAETRWRSERLEQRDDFLRSLAAQHKTDKEAMVALQASFVVYLNQLEQRVIDRYTDMMRQMGEVQDELDNVCQYRPRGARQSWGQPRGQDDPAGGQPS